MVLLSYVSCFTARMLTFILYLSFSVQVLLLKKEQSHEAKDLRRKIDSLMIWISTAEHKLNTQFPIAQDLDTITKQKYDLEVTQFKYTI